MAEIGKVAVKSRVWAACGCCFVVLKQHPKYDHLVMVVVDENCGKVVYDPKKYCDSDHNERRKGTFRSFKKSEAVRWDPLAEELFRKFGGSFA